MNLLSKVNQQLNIKRLAEDAAGGATGAGSVAGGGMPLFSKLVQRSKPTLPAQPDVVSTADEELELPKKRSKRSLGEMFRTLSEELTDGTNAGGNPNTRNNSNFDSTEVISKLKGLENKEKQDHRDTVTFGLEDENGQIVRVTVKDEQAQDFEKSLQALMANDEDDQQERPEIAEVLFKLKDRFDIVDVCWPEIAEDEEQDTQLQGAAPNPADGEVDPTLDAAPVDTGSGDTGQVQDLLTQVIDMMKADAEARKADARAREAEAKVKEADAIATQAMTRVKQEEQYLDMDEYNKSKKAEEKEAKRLAQLSRWKHETSRDRGIDDDPDESDMSMPMNSAQSVEQEETASSRKSQHNKPAPARGRVHPHDLASFILSRVK